jgi:hypothetical protein
VYGKLDLLKLYVSRGARLDHPPDTISKAPVDKKSENYRKSPFLIQACCYSNPDVVKYLVSQGCKLTENGCIGLSKKRKNHVTSNVLGAAAYNGNDQVLKYLLSALNVLNVNLPATEKSDVN